MWTGKNNIMVVDTVAKSKIKQQGKQVGQELQGKLVGYQVVELEALQGHQLHSQGQPIENSKGQIIKLGHNKCT